MANLKAVVAELKDQNDTMADVRDSIKELLQTEIDRRKEEERSKGDELEEKREAKAARNKAKTARAAPKSLAQGFAQGSGLAGLADMFPSFGNMLGGASLGGLLGMAAGKLFLPALGAILGGKYIGEWLETNLPSMFADGKTMELFGKEIEVSKIGGAIAGVVGMILAPKLLSKLLSATFGIGTATGRMLLARVIGAMGISKAVTAGAEAAGDLVKEAADAKKVNEATRKSTKFTKFKQLFKVAGSGLVRLTIPGAIIGTGVAAAYLLAQYIENRREKLLAEMTEDLDKYMAEVPGLIKAGETKKAADRMTLNLNRQLQLGENVDKAFIKESRAAVDEMPPGAQKNNFNAMLNAMEQQKPSMPQLDTASAISFANVTAAGQIASLEETILKRLPISFSQLTRNEQEAIVGRMIGDMGLATAGVSASQLAVDFLNANFKKEGTSFFNRPVAPNSYQNLSPEALADMYYKGYTGQRINVVNNNVNNNTNVSGGSKSSGGGQFGKAIDQYYIEKLMMQQGVRPGFGIYGF
jgi:hypothetical protein